VFTLGTLCDENPAGRIEQRRGNDAQMWLSEVRPHLLGNEECPHLFDAFEDAVAVLEFLAAAARARLVAADLGRRTHRALLLGWHGRRLRRRLP